VADLNSVATGRSPQCRYDTNDKKKDRYWKTHSGIFFYFQDLNIPRSFCHFHWIFHTHAPAAPINPSYHDRTCHLHNPYILVVHLIQTNPLPWARGSFLRISQTSADRWDGLYAAIVCFGTSLNPYKASCVPKYGEFPGVDWSLDTWLSGFQAYYLLAVAEWFVAFLSHHLPQQLSCIELICVMQKATVFIKTGRQNRLLLAM